LFFGIASNHFESQRTPEHALERGGVPVGGPTLELDIAGRPKAHQVVISSGYEIDAGEGLRVAAVEAFGEPDHSRECPDGLPRRAAQRAVFVVRFLGYSLSMVSRDERDDVNFGRIESAEPAVPNQIL
jgi:hypothetical protein